MTKAELVDKIASQTGIEKKLIATVTEEFMDAIKASMADGENVYLRGFGTFRVTRRAEKTARNIAKGTTIIIPAHDVPTFKPAPNFVARVKR